MRISKTKISIVLLSVALAGAQLPLQAQGSSTRSPYSRYGYGILSDRSSGAGHAMGGIGYGLQHPAQINTLNPASYAAVDSLTFLFDLGVDFQFAVMKEEGNRQKAYNGNIRNINMLFPIGKRWAFSAGLIPVSTVGYDYGLTDENGVTTSYYGSGGLLQAYGGLAYRYGDFSAGINVGYLFGSVEHYAESLVRDNPNMDSITIRPHDLTYTLGVQQKIRLNEKQLLVVGAAYTPKITTTATGIHTRRVGSDLVDQEVFSGDAYELAQTVGIGASLLTQNKWLAGADVQWENWKNARFEGFGGEQLNDRFRYGAGLEYTPDARSRSYFKRVKYRFGGHYSNSYITTDQGVTYDETGVSFGLALPVYNKSVLHLSFDYVNVLPSISNKLSENYFKVTLNYVFNETWFYKRHIQ